MERIGDHDRRPGPVLGALLRAPAQLDDLGCGWMLGGRFLRLTHVGRGSGRRYRTVLEVIGTRPGELLVLVGFGPSADRYRNLRAARTVEVGHRRDRFRAAWRTLEPDAAAAALAEYERRHRLITPVVRLVLSRLLGWRYDGSVASRRRLVRKLPVVALRPVDRERPGRRHDDRAYNGRRTRGRPSRGGGRARRLRGGSAGPDLRAGDGHRRCGRPGRLHPAARRAVRPRWAGARRRGPPGRCGRPAASHHHQQRDEPARRRSRARRLGRGAQPDRCRRPDRRDARSPTARSSPRATTLPAPPR